MDLDQFYTNPEYAVKFYHVIQKKIDLEKFDYLLEPSAGTGSFFNLMDESKRIGLDLDPKAPCIQEQDFFTWVPPLGRIATIGNPPFGKNASLAVRFFNEAANWSEAIAFILPRTFRKASVVNRLNPYFKLIYDKDVPPDSFIYESKPYDVPCCAQIWAKNPSIKRKQITVRKMSDVKQYFEIVPAREADFAIQRVGGDAGKIKYRDFVDLSPLSNYFIKAHDPRVLKAFEQVDFSVVKSNTVGNPSISAGELVELWLAKFDINSP